MSEDSTGLPTNEDSDEGVLYRLGSQIKTFQIKLERLLMLINQERTSAEQFDISLRRRLWLWRHGFLTESEVYFDLTKETVDDYVTNYQRDIKTKDINGRSGRVLDDKLVFHQMLTGKFTEFLPNTYAYISDGRLCSIDLGKEMDSEAMLVDKVKRGDGLVCKPRVGGGGKDVYIIEHTDNEYRVNGDHVPLKKIEAFLNTLDEYLVCEKIQQAEYASTIYPDAVNTIRIVTMIDPDTDEPFVGGVAHRFGTDFSAPVDNYSRGGITSSIETSSGMLGPAAWWQDKKGFHWLDNHPNTGAQITDTTVTQWSRVVESLLEIAEQFPNLPYIGWDIVITGTEGEFKLIEGNRYSGIRVLQMHKPLLEDERVRRFYEHYDVVS